MKRKKRWNPQTPSGIHPHDASNWDAAAEQNVRRLAAHPKCVGGVILQRFFSGKLRVLPLFEFWWKHSPSISEETPGRGENLLKWWYAARHWRVWAGLLQAWPERGMFFIGIFWQTIEGCYQPTRISWNGMSLVGFVANFSNWGLDIGHLIKILWVKWSSNYPERDAWPPWIWRFRKSGYQGCQSYGPCHGSHGCLWISRLSQCVWVATRDASAIKYWRISCRFAVRDGNIKPSVLLPTWLRMDSPKSKWFLEITAPFWSKPNYLSTMDGQ